MDRVEELLDALLQREGGYVDHPADRGGPTNWGITQAVARSQGYVGAMRELSRDEARAIYRKLYWKNPGFDAVEPLAPRVAEELFDTGVNMGPAVAIGFLQRALNALNCGGRDWTDLMIDRNLGPVTLAALHALMKRRGAPAEAVLLRALNALQGERYIALSEDRPANEAFTWGWFAQRIA